LRTTQIENGQGSLNSAVGIRYSGRWYKVSPMSRKRAARQGNGDTVFFY
jgi:hypothetical protein